MGVPNQRTVDKFNRLLRERVELLNDIEMLKGRYSVLTDQYMNGNILGPIGKEQAKIEREIDKRKHRIRKIDKEINSIRIKYNLSM